MTYGPEPLEIATGHRAVPVRCFTGGELLPDEASQRQLNEIAALEGVDEYVAVLPDVHFKRRNPTPTGTVIVSRSQLVPRAVDPGINCGMRMVATGVPAGELSPKGLDLLFGRLIEEIPIEPRERPLLSTSQCERLLAEGLPAVADVLGIPPWDLSRIENGGTITPAVDPDVIRRVVSPKAVKKGNRWLGTLGAGNHFLELQEIVAILDEPVARRLGLQGGDAVFMMHTDSRRLGKRVLRPVLEEAMQAAGSSHAPEGLWTIAADSDIGQRYVAALAAAAHAGFANRAALTEILRRVMRAVVGDGSLQLPLLYDCAHESIQREQHGGRSLWVHRHGASHALPPSALAHDPVLGDVGQPVPIPGSMGTESYIGVARPGVIDTFHSVAHGAGRLIEKIHAAEQFDAARIARDLGTAGIRLYRYGTDNIAGQAPASFKDVRRVVDVMTAFDLIRPVARLRPIAVLKG